MSAIGLTKVQAQAYASLIEHGSLKPPEAAKYLEITRTNAYKLFDKLVELNIAIKKENGKKITYYPANPMSLASIAANYRAEAVAREEAVNSIMHNLLDKYYEHSSKPQVEVVSGRKNVASTYRKQINLKEDIYFIHTKADIPMMSFEAMHEIRTAPVQHGNQRKGILTAPTEGPINYKQHKRSNLEITWLEKGRYTAPVEWSVTKSSLLIILYAKEPHAILIVDKVVATAFMQVWSLLSSMLKERDIHKKLASKSNEK